MLKKYLLFLIIFTIAISTVMNTRALSYYVTLNITMFETATTNNEAEVAMAFISHTNSPIGLRIFDSSYAEQFSETRDEIREYKAGEEITIGPVDLTAGSQYYFNITFDEVLVGANYFGSCTTDKDDVYSYCKNCAGTTVACLTEGGNVLGTNGYAPYHSTIGSTGGCNGDTTTVACGWEISDALDGTNVESFSIGFMA